MNELNKIIVNSKSFVRWLDRIRKYYPLQSNIGLRFFAGRITAEYPSDDGFICEMSNDFETTMDHSYVIKLRSILDAIDEQPVTIQFFNDRINLLSISI